MSTDELSPCPINVSSETGHLRAVLLRRPGLEIERMNPHMANEALYNDILSQPLAAQEHALFAKVLEQWCHVYYVNDIMCWLMDNDAFRHSMIEASVDGDTDLAHRLADMSSQQLTRALIEGLDDPKWDGVSLNRYHPEPLYNLFFTRDASATLYNRVLINTMSFSVRQRETLLYDAIFRNFFQAETFCAAHADAQARTEGGDIQVTADDTLCIGESIRTNRKGIEYLAQTYAKERDHFNIIVQELPHSPESFIHLDMMFTMLGKHRCMMFEPMLKKTGIFSGKHTTLIRIDNGNVSYHDMPDVLTALNEVGHSFDPLFCGGDDPWQQLREQWHSGANFFALDDERIIGYRRNTRTIDILDKAGFDVLNAEDVVTGMVDMSEHQRFVVTFPASELPRAGGGARCMTMPILRD